MLADNKIALDGGWDEELLAAELRALSSAELDVSIDVTGFSIAWIDALIDLDAPEEDRNPRDDSLPLAVPARGRPGDLWALGPHRLICDDSCDGTVVERLMPGSAARMIFTDPPYNVPIDGHVGGLGRLHHREFAMASGEMSPEAFTGFLHQVFGHLANHSIDGAIHYIFMDWRHMGEVQAAANGIYSDLKNLIVWVKDTGGMGSFYRSRHELIFVFKKGTAPHLNSFELGQHGRYRTNVWECRGANLAELALHPTVKPVAMIADAIRDVSGRGEIVLDLFGGSGSTLIAAEKTGRRGYLCEIDPAYCDLILARWEDYAKDKVVLWQRAAGVVAEAGGPRSI